ncbi:MAG: hypothetical protein HQK87_10955 [Nitrospinae bacterium]|nr:hypothetical protein [Nitrospinota bacterium]
MIGKDAYVGRHTRLTAVGGTLTLADRANLSTWVRLTARQNLSIGAKTLLGPHGALEDLPGAPITIGSNVWLGASVTVAPGVTVGDDTVVGTAARIETSLPPRVIAVGRPARVIKERG